jgi:hypothetical protein
MSTNNPNDFLEKIKNSISLEDDKDILTIQCDGENYEDVNDTKKYDVGNGGKVQLLEAIELMIESSVNKIMEQRMELIIEKIIDKKLEKTHLKILIKQAIQDFFK